MNVTYPCGLTATAATGSAPLPITCPEHGEDCVAPVAAPVQEQTRHWAVMVDRNGENVITIETNHLSGRDISDEDARVIRLCAENLLSFAGSESASPSLPLTGQEKSVNDTWDSADIDQAKADLLAAGWKAKDAITWIAPDGSRHRGPAGAWRTMKRALNDEAHGILASQRATFDSENAKADARIERPLTGGRAGLDIALTALREIADDEGVWSDGDGLRDGDPAFRRVREIAQKALRDATPRPQGESE